MNLTLSEQETLVTEPRSILSEWTELAKYLMKLVQEFFKMKGLRVNLPEGARTVEDEEENGKLNNNCKNNFYLKLLTFLQNSYFFSMKTEVVLTHDLRGCT